MTPEQKILVEGKLAKAIFIFHDNDDKETRENDVRNYFFSFCHEYNIIESEALDIIEKMLENTREKSIFKYEHYTNLKEILYPRKVDLDSDER